MKIYFAAPIHKEEDARSNAVVIKALRDCGYEVWAPQEAGIATEVAKSTGRPLTEVRKEFMKKDLSAMKTCDVCVAYVQGREPSDGMLWEMGWFVGMNKPVLILNVKNEVKYTLMAEFTCDFMCASFNELEEILGDMV